MSQLIRHLAPLPALARQSLTFDRGLKFVSWRELAQGMGTAAWFCDPQAPWQKGTVENTNKRVRRYLPPETIVLDVTNQQIRSLCDRLNATPRKCLGFQTPTEIFSQHLLALELEDVQISNQRCIRSGTSTAKLECPVPAKLECHSPRV